MQTAIPIETSECKLIAHRGLSALETENTAAAFIAAGNRDYYGIETDVHLTGDGRFILCHDDSTLRTGGVDHRIEETDFDTLRALRLLDHTTGKVRHDLVLPTPEEYLHICEHYGKISVLEIKNTFSPERLHTLVDTIQETGTLKNVLFISFHRENLMFLRKLLPDQPMQFLTSEFAENLTDFLQEYNFGLDIYFRALNQERVLECKEKQIPVNVWTVDHPEDARALIDWGVNYITTNILVPKRA